MGCKWSVANKYGKQNMVDGTEASSEAPGDSASLPSSSSSRVCGGCRRPVKGHVGLCGEDRCIIGMLEALRLRVEQLE